MITRCVAVSNSVFVRQRELRQDISNLQAEIEDIKLAQNNKINEIRDEVENGMKDEIYHALE